MAWSDGSTGHSRWVTARGEDSSGLYSSREDGTTTMGIKQIGCKGTIADDDRGGMDKSAGMGCSSWWLLTDG